MPEVDLGLAERGRLGGDAEVARHRQLAAAAERDRVDRGDRDRRRLLHAAHEAVRRLDQLARPRRPASILVNSLMSAPAQNVKMFDEAITSARTLPSTSSQTRDQRRARASGESGLAGGRLSQAIADVAARLEQDGLALVAGVGLRVGEEALAGLLAEPALGDQPAQDRAAARRRRPTRARRARAPRARRRGPASSARLNGPGRMPAPIIIPISMSLADGDALLEHEAGLDQGLQPEPLDERSVELRLSCRAHRSPFRSSGRGCRPRPAPSSWARRRSGRRSDSCRCSATCRTVSRPSRSVRKNGPIGTVPESLMTLSTSSTSRPSSSVTRQTSDTAELRMRLTTKPGTSPQRIAVLRICCAKLAAAWTVSSRGLLALDHLDQPHHRRGVEEVEAADLVRAARGLAHLGDRQRRGVRGEDRVAGRDRVELGEHRLLDLHPLGHGLDRRSRRRRSRRSRACR